MKSALVALGRGSVHTAVTTTFPGSPLPPELAVPLLPGGPCLRVLPVVPPGHVPALPVCPKGHPTHQRPPVRARGQRPHTSMGSWGLGALPSPHLGWSWSGAPSCGQCRARHWEGLQWVGHPLQLCQGIFGTDRVGKVQACQGQSPGEAPCVGAPGVSCSGHMAGFTAALLPMQPCLGESHPPSPSLREVGRDIGAEAANPC